MADVAASGTVSFGLAVTAAGFSSLIAVLAGGAFICAVSGTARGLSGVTIFCVTGWGDAGAVLDDVVASGLGVVAVSVDGDGLKNFFTPEKNPPF